MAAGTALVASDIDGYRTVSRADREALLVPPGDAECSAPGPRSRCSTTPPGGLRWSPTGRKRADEFSMAHLAERFLPLYERAIAAARHGPPRRAEPAIPPEAQVAVTA